MQARIGRYRLLRELARGGFGVVYAAHDPHLDRPVAIKQLLAGRGASPVEIARFQREARAVARLQHANIVQVHEVGQDQGSWFIVMDLVEGRGLDQRVREGGPLAQHEAVKITLQLALALAYAHQHAILHRDIKPQNVLLTAEGVPKLTDFGLAKVTDLRRKAGEPGQERERRSIQDTRLMGGQSLTLDGEVLGTPAYMPPEQAAGERDRIDGRADIYSLGATLYELLTGSPPFAGANLINLLNAVFTKAPQRPSELRKGLDPDLERICLCCLEKDPADRYSDAKSLATDLSAWLEIRTQSRRHASVSRRPSGYASGRSGALILGAAGACAALLLLLAGFLRSGSQPLTPVAAVTPTTPAPKGTLHPALDPPHVIEPPPPPPTPTPVASPELADSDPVSGTATEPEQHPANAAREAQLQATLAQGIRMFEAKDFEGAIERCSQVLQFDPVHTDARFVRAMAWAGRGSAEQAISDFTQLIELESSRSFDCYVNRGLLRAQLGDAHAAKADFDAAIELRPEHPRGYQARANVKQQLKDLEGAVDDYTEVLRRDPTSVDALINRGSVKKFQGDLQGALRDYDRALSIEAVGIGFRNRGSLKESMGDGEGAALDYEQSLRVEGRHPQADLLRRKIQGILGRPSQY